MSSFQDRIQGMLYGVAIGDSLGFPHEFKRTSPSIRYTGRISQQEFEISFQYAKIKVPASSYSDDTEMTLALYSSIKDGKYDRNSVILSYLQWANSKPIAMGKNTRSLLQGVKTLAGYQRRMNKLTAEEKLSKQSNGCLMRASPLVLVDKSFIETDVSITNPNPLCIETVTLYVDLLRLLSQGKSKDDLKDYLCSYKCKDPELSHVVSDILTQTDRKTGHPTKGWVLTSFYVAVRGFLFFDTFDKSMDWIIDKNPYSDTDTNAAISGAFWGMFLGEKGLPSENLSIIKEFMKTYKRAYVL